LLINPLGTDIYVKGAPSEMIRMAFMTDSARVIGASSPDANAARFELLPEKLSDAMTKLYVSENIAVGARSFTQFIKGSKHTYVITRGENYIPPRGREDVICINNFMELVDKYGGGEGELLIVGGKTIFKLFLPYTTSLDIAETHELVPGDIVFDDWLSAGFEKVEEEARDGFRVIRYTSKYNET